MNYSIGQSVALHGVIKETMSERRVMVGIVGGGEVIVQESALLPPAPPAPPPQELVEVIIDMITPLAPPESVGGPVAEPIEAAEPVAEPAPRKPLIVVRPKKSKKANV